MRRPGAGPDGADGRAGQAAAPRGLAVELDSLPEWQRHLEGLGLKLLDAPAQVPGGLWSRDHEGNLINIRDEGIAPWREFGTTDGQGANLGDRVRRVDQARWLNA